ncbi:MAG: class I SAM-dependent DNA methyltransferase [Eubacteriales bacterium]
MDLQQQGSFIWSVADILRGRFKQHENGGIILPFTVLRRFDCILAPHKQTILDLNKTLTIDNKLPIFQRKTGLDFYNTSLFDFDKLVDDSTNLEANLYDYINGYSENIIEIMEHFDFFAVIKNLAKADLLYPVVQRFSEIDIDDKSIDNLGMGYIFEELVRKFSEQSNDTAGQHFTPREVIELMVDLLLEPDSELLQDDNRVVTMFDPCCGTGGMLSVGQNRIRDISKEITVIPYGQELNPSTFATCCADMILKGNKSSKIHFGNSLTQDGFPSEHYDYMLSNPPFGVDWKLDKQFMTDEAENMGFSGRFGAGLPRVSDGSLLFLQHMMSKMTDQKKGGSRIAVVFNGSPLFTGDAGSGESNIRQYVIENDLLEAVIGLPNQLFYNTGIATYIWVLSNRKEQRRKGKIRLVNGVNFFEKMRKSLGDKRNLISDSNRAEIVKLYSQYEDSKNYKDFFNEDFGYTKITVERPLYDENGEIVTDKKGNPKPDPKLRDTESVPLTEDIEEYFKREVLPHVPDAWIDEKKHKVGYEIPFTRHFYEFTPLRSSGDIMEEIRALEERISKNLWEVFR